jgi:hypothetical protein
MKALSAHLYAIMRFAPLALVACATTAAHSAGADNTVKIIDGVKVIRTKCEWHNFFQSMNMWPRYRACPGKSAYASFGAYLSASSASSSIDTFLDLNRGQRQPAADYVTPVGSVRISFKIGDVPHTASACAWYNLFQSRYRTPLYVKCERKTNDQSFGSYSEPDYWKGRVNAASPRKAPDIQGFLEGQEGADLMTLPIGGVNYTRSFCEWHNFLQSFNPLPRFVTCSGKTAVESFSQYRFGQNIVALNVKMPANADATSIGFGEPVSFQLGAETIIAKRCALYNWLQSNIRWPIYRGCGTISQDSFATADPRIFPKADKRFLYDQNYTD